MLHQPGSSQRFHSLLSQHDLQEQLRKRRLAYGTDINLARPGWRRLSVAPPGATRLGGR